MIVAVIAGPRWCIHPELGTNRWMIIPNAMSIEIPMQDTSQNYHCSRRQFRISGTFAVTAHKAEGRTCAKVIIDVPESCSSDKLREFYVMITRSGSLDNLKVLGEFTDAILKARVPQTLCNLLSWLQHKYLETEKHLNTFLLPSLFQNIANMPNDPVTYLSTSNLCEGPSTNSRVRSSSISLPIPSTTLKFGLSTKKTMLKPLVVSSNGSLVTKSKITTLELNKAHFANPLSYQTLRSRHPDLSLDIHPIEGDGNCGFRSVAFTIYGDQNQWPRVRTEMLTHMQTYQGFWEYYLECSGSDIVTDSSSSETKYNQMKRRLTHLNGSCLSNTRLWWVNDCAEIAASCFQRSIYVLSDEVGGVRTDPLLSLVTYPTCTIAHVNGNHYVAITNLSEQQILARSNWNEVWIGRGNRWLVANGYTL
jgi:hypothetical protein